MNLDQLSRFQFGEEAYKKFQLSVKDKRELVNLINESVYRKSAKTSQEMFEVLDLRDKMLKLVRYDLLSQMGGSDETLSTNPIITGGSCLDMCPEKERYSRDYLNLCGKYEMQYDPTADDYQIDYAFMIKEYTRSSADQDIPLPNEMRPLDVLYDTMLYLIDQVITRIETERNEQPPDMSQSDEIRSDFNLGEWYDFIWNRTRSIRKDIIQQRLLLNEIPRDSELVNPVTGVLIIEQCARFHIMCSYRLSNESPEVFDFKINEENLKNCFQSLRQYYEATSGGGSNAPGSSQPTLPPSPNEAEFRAYIILLNLGESNILSEIRRWPKHVRYSPQVRFALSMYSAYNSRNYVNFFRLIQSDSAGCDYLQACALHRHFYKVRIDALRAIFTAFKTRERSFPLNKLCEVLGFDDHDSVIEYCNMLDFEIVGDESDRQIIMPGGDFSRFNIGQQDQAKLKGQRSTLLIQSKFYQKLNDMLSTSSQITAEECLAQIINGGETRPSRFLELNSLQSISFDDSGHFVGTEIQDFIDYANSVLSTSSGVVSRASASDANGMKTRAARQLATNSALGAKKPSAVVQKAKSLVAKAAQRQASLSGDKSINEDASGATPASIRNRKKSVSSNSSESSFKSIGKSGKAKAPLANQSNKPEEQKKNLFSLIKSNADFNKNVPGSTITKPVDKPPGLFAQQRAFTSGAPNINPFSFIANKPQASTTSLPPPASQKPTTTAFPPAATAKPVVSAPNLFSTVVASKSAEQSQPSQNLFGNLIKKQQEPIPATAAPLSLPVTSQSSGVEKEKIIDQLCESTFQSIYLELVGEMSKDYLHKFKAYSSMILDTVLQQDLPNMVNSIVRDEVGVVKQQQDLAKRKMHEMERTASEIFDSLVTDMTSGLSATLLNEMREAERYLHEEITNMVFQREFEIIIKQIANEINYEIRLDNLAENIYMNYAECLVQPNGAAELRPGNDLVIEVANLNNHKNSIFMNDLYSFLHECVYECTRLSLNVNRELYYEIKQALEMNQQFFLFRKWRLKSSSVLLHKAYKTQHGRSSSSPEAHLISFLAKYSTFLMQNLDKFYKIYSFFIANDSLNIIHSEHYQRHLAWHLSLNHRHFLLDLLMENYFSIIRNDDDQHIPFPTPSSQLTRTQIHLKLILAMSTSDSSSPSTTEECWLIKKFFNSNDVLRLLEPSHHHLESFALDPLYPDEYNIKFCIKLFKANSRPDSHYFNELSSNRSMYATNSVIFVLAKPSPGQTSLDKYLKEMQQQFARLIRLINSSINTCMFVSFMSDESQTRQAIDYILRATFNTDSIPYTCCQLDSNSMDHYVKNNGTLIHVYQEFLQSSFKSIRDACLFDLAPTPLSDLFYESMFVYLDSFSVKKTYVPLATAASEFNKRLKKLIEIVANLEYKKIAFPMPELVEADKWTLKFWNEDECLRGVLGEQVYDLMYLDERGLDEMEDNFDDQDQMEFEDLERMALGYFYNVLNKKLAKRCLRETRESKSSSNESVISIFKIENLVRSNLEKFKNGSTTVKMYQVNWSALILIPIMEFLIINGQVNFKNQLLHLDEFFIYYDSSQIKKHDWTYTFPSTDLTRVKKRPPIQQDLVVYSPLGSSANKSKRKFGLNDSLNDSQSPRMPRTSSKKQNVTRNYDPESATQLNLLDAKLDQFFEKLASEKENTNKFSQSLSKVDSENMNNQEVLTSNSKRNIDDDEKLDVGTSLELLLGRLQEEKRRNERFNHKLNEMFE